MDALVYGMKMVKGDTFKMVLHSGVAPDLKGGEGMARADEELFTVYRAANGFYARMQSGGIVVGTTLSEACIAAQGSVADAIIREEMEDGSDKSKWKRV